ncbi:MAG: hypothetical protein ABIQ16_16630 [Polyangiaceae bacterium]
MFSLRHLALSCVSLASVAAGACASAPESPVSRLPRYGAEVARLLDDGFSGHLFETAFVPGTAGDDSRFDDRVRAAESIWLVKVATVSREGSFGDNRRYNLVFRELETLAGPRPIGAISLTVSGKDPSFHWLDRVGGAWVGREVSLMVRSFRAGDQVVTHFHGEPSSPELRARILQVRMAQATAARERAAPAAQK